MELERCQSREIIYELTITVNTSGKQFIDTTVTIITDVPGEEKLVLPVTALIE